MSDLRGAVLAQRYEIEGLIGEGGMGKVYRARHLRLNKPVAIKSLIIQGVDPNEAQARVRQFETEAQILAGLSHPALVQVSDFFEHGGTHFLVMEFVEGKTLSAVANLAPRPISERRVLQWASELLDVLEYLHGQTPPIILKDLKPDNVMLMDSGRLKVIDFGIAKRLTPTGGTMDIAKGVGTEEYAPLEQYGHGSTDQRSDLYSLGATLYYLLTKRPPLPAWQRATKGEELPDPRQFNDTVSEATALALRKLTALFAHDRPSDVQTARHLFAGKAGTAYGLSANQMDTARTQINQPSVGRSRALRLELRSKVDILAPAPGSSPHILWYPGESLLALGRRGVRVIRLPAGADPKTPLKIALECAKNLDVHSLTISRDRRWLAMSEASGQVYLFDASQGKPGPTLGNRSGLWPEKIRELRFGIGHRLLFALSDAQQLASYDVNAGRKYLIYRPNNSWLSLLGTRLRSFDVSSGQQVGAGASDGSIFMWDIATAKLQWQIRKNGPIQSMGFSPDGYFLVSATEEGQLTLMKADDGYILSEMQQPKGLQNLAWSHDGRIIASGDQTGHIRFWDLANAQEALRLQGSTTPVKEMAWSEDKRLAVVWSDNSVRVLNLSW